jgi:serine/threonine-protein kinase
MQINERFKETKEISKGMSGDKKYRCIDKEGNKYLLRISDVANYDMKKKEYDFLKKLNEADLPIPRCIEFGKDGELVYTLLSWIDGEEAEKTLPYMSEGKQYEMGLQAGKILRMIHEKSKIDELSQNWYDRYFDVIQPRLDAYHKEGISFEGADKITDFIEANKFLLKEREQCGLHGDYHMGNLIINDGKLSVIDWHTVDFDNIGDPWYEFNRIGAEHPAFASGQIDGYFVGKVPEEFWKVFALYFSTSAITSIVWAKYCAPTEMDYIMQLNENMLIWFDEMRNPIPTWYKNR